MCEAERWRAITSQMPPQLANGMLTQAAVSRGQAGYTVRSWRFADDSMLCRDGRREWVMAPLWAVS